ncbi:MAG: VWA domain-containing protein, partial [Luminiphilus sp.]|nr:VWA domain-containing protein [Luminiphilus sp.]
ELLKHLVEDSQTAHQSARQFWWLALPILILAASGPSLERAELPVFEKADALVIVLDLSQSMWAEDVQPSRIRRARQKILDILDQRDEGVTGLVVFAGDAHVVTPLTDDTRTIENLLSALDPGIMPLQGSNPTQALLLATDLLATSGLTNGSVLLMTDGLPKINEGAIRSAMTDVGGELSILAVGTESGAPVPIPSGGFLRDDDNNIVIPTLDAQNLSAVASKLSARLETISVDESDVKKLLRINPSSVTASDSLERRTDIWIDEGHWLALLAALLILPLFRRGALSVLLIGTLLGLPETALANAWTDLWSTPDQQAADLLKNGEPAAAAQRFQDPDWRGAAHFQAGDYRSAAAEFGQSDSADAHYNRGNSLALAGDLKGALKSYDASLAIAPDREDTKKNSAIVEALLEQEEQQSEEQAGDQGEDSSDQSEDSENSENSDQNSEQSDSEQQGSSSESDQSPMDQEGNEQEQISEPVEPSDLEAATEAQMAKFSEALEEQQALEQWLRRVPDDPGGLLRRKFRYQSLQRLRDGEEPDEDIRW